jgi:hypothetical protein
MRKKSKRQQCFFPPGLTICATSDVMAGPILVATAVDSYHWSNPPLNMTLSVWLPNVLDKSMADDLLVLDGIVNIICA